MTGSREAIDAPAAPAALVGHSKHWVETLTHFALDFGFGTFVLVPPPEPTTFATFIEDVAPEVRDRVAEWRVSSALPTPTISKGAVR
jgi:alkanesulfonate monooxygenase SsuD/methylene tetrahydromethanopterin reductase-like flavin-dependent oxidoreductase (luciferase family)